MSLSSQTTSPPVTITKLEKQLLTDIATSDHSSDGYGFTMWVNCGYETMSMNQARGVISSLLQKEVIWFTPADPRNGDMYAHVCPRASFVELCESSSNEFTANPFIEGAFGYKYVNLKVIE